MPFSAETLSEKPYNRCIRCDNIGIKCDGPNFLAMTQERFGEWCRLRKEYLGWTNAHLSEVSGISDVSVSRVLSGKAQGLHVDTMRSITKALVNGSWGQYPCANVETEIETVYVDNPQLLDRVRQSEIDCAVLRGQLEDASVKVEHLVKQVNFRGDLLTERAEFLRKKDWAILALGIAAAVFVCVSLFLFFFFAAPDLLDGSWGRIRY